MKKIPKYKTSHKSHTVHDLPKSERPRERLKEKGADKLSDSELLAILLRTGSKGENVLLTAQKLISEYKSLHKLADASLEDLQKIKGIGPDKAVTLAACFRIAQLINKAESEELNKRIEKGSATDPENALELIKPYIGDLMKEQFIVASFDTRNRLLGVDPISTGTLTASLVHPRETFESAIRRHAASIIIAHNHPSGDAEPSEEDIKITKRLVEAGKVMGIEVLDHLIITNNKYYSFKEKGMM